MELKKNLTERPIMRYRIDADSHYLDPNVFQYVGKENQNRVPRFDFDDDGKLIAVNFLEDPNAESMNPLPLTAHNRFLGFCQLDKRIRELELLGVKFQILNPQEHSMRFSYMVEKDLAVDMVYSFNRSIKDTVDQNSDKFAAPAMIAMQDVDWSLKEMKWAKDNGFNSILVDTSWPSREYAPGWPIITAPRFEEIVEACVELDLLLNFHHQMHQIDYNHIPNFRNNNLHNLFPSHHKTALIGMATSGLLKKYPTLKILLSEGLMKYIMPSYEYLKKNHSGDIDRYFVENFHFTIEPEQTKELLECVKTFGSKNFLFATDYPHDDPGGEMKFHDYKILENIDLLTEEDKNNICYANAKRLYKLDNLKT